ncbi:hypothetical protein ABT224_27100 [Streptomyces sp. NPDC001584]|uniref:hypothetical protein n=1 Tax=Streptomyces sp. NPDC001584 TaxID=3154521 RepID=UPI00331F38DD
MPRKTKWMIALAVLFVAVVEVPALVWFCGLLYAIDHAGQTETRATGCGRAMTAMGWKLPPGAERQQCLELDDPAWPSQWSGTFRMPRAEVRGWLDSHPKEHLPSQRDPRGVFEFHGELHLHINYPKAPNFGNGDIDKIEVQVAWEGEDSAVVTFKTYPG